jgi:phage major head subunit gpT-like protein
MSDLSALTSRAIKAALFQEMEMVDGNDWVPQVCGPVIASDQEIETYTGVGAIAGMRERVGGRLLKKPAAYSMTLRNIPYEDSLYVNVEEIERDKTGQVQMRIRELGERARTHWAKLASDLLIAGETTVCYDGQYFFDTDHVSASSGTQSNHIESNITTTTAPTAGEMEGAILKSIGQIFAFKDDAGEPANESARRFMVMVPVPFMAAAASAIGSQIIVDAASTGGRTNNIITLGNVGGFTVDLRVNPRLSWTTKFATFRTDAASTPLVRQEEMALKISSQAEESPAEFERYRHEYGVDTSRAAGFYNWNRAVLTTFI